MRKIHVEEITTPKEILDDIICNCCGSPIKKGSEIHVGYPNDIYEEYITIHTSFGYFANHFCDGEVHKFDVCEECYANWLKCFKIAPEGFGRTSDCDEELVNFEEWKEKD